MARKSTPSDSANRYVQDEARKRAATALLGACEEMISTVRGGYAYSLKNLIESFRSSAARLQSDSETTRAIERAFLLLDTLEGSFILWIETLQFSAESRPEARERGLALAISGAEFYARRLDEIVRDMVKSARQVESMSAQWVDNYSSFRTEWNNALLRAGQAVAGLASIILPEPLGELGVLIK